MNNLSAALLAASLLVVQPITAEENDLVGFKMSAAIEQLRSHSRVTEARKLETLRSSIPGYRLEYVLVLERYLNPGLYADGQAIGSYEVYGLAASASTRELNYEELIWRKIEDPAGALLVLRNFAPLLAEAPRDVEVLNHSALSRLRKLLLLNKTIPDEVALDEHAIDVFRRGLFPDMRLLPFAKDEDASVIMIGFTGPQVHAYAVPAPTARWRPTIIHLWAEERALALQLLDFVKGPIFPFRIIMKPKLLLAPDQPNDSDSLLEELARSIALRFNFMGTSSPQTVVPSQHQVIDGRIVVSGFLDDATLRASHAEITFGAADFAFVDGLRLVEVMDVFRSNDELVLTVLQMNSSGDGPRHLLQHEIDFGTMSAFDLAEFVDLARLRGETKRLPQWPQTPTTGNRSRQTNPAAYSRYRRLASEIIGIDLQLRRVVEAARYVHEESHSVKEVLVLAPEFPRTAWRSLVERSDGTQIDYVSSFLHDTLETTVTKGKFASMNPDDANTIRVIILVD